MEEKYVVTEVKKGVKHIPGFIKIEAAKTSPSLWDWDIYFTEGEFRNNRVCRWERTDRKPRIFHMDSIHTDGDCDPALDPIPGLYELAADLAADFAGKKSYPRLDLCGGMEHTTLDIAGITANIMALYITRNAGNKAPRSFAYSFIVPKHNLYRELYAAFCAFGAGGGWMMEYEYTDNGDSLLCPEWSTADIDN